MKLFRKYTTADLLNDNKAVGGVSISLKHNLLVYRDGRTGVADCPEDPTKVLKVGKIDANYQASECHNVWIGRITSDPRIVEWNNKVYVAVTLVVLNPVGYTCSIDLLDLQTNQLLNLTFPYAKSQEKNWIFFQVGEDLLCSYSLWDCTHKVLKLSGNTLEFYCSSNYHTEWDRKFGPIKNTSNYVLYDGLLWNCIHSHDGYYYRMGIVAISPTYPFNVVKISHVPLFSQEDFYWSNHLSIEDGIFRLGISTRDHTYFDLIDISYDEIKNHLNHNVSYLYPQ